MTLIEFLKNKSVEEIAETIATEIHNKNGIPYTSVWSAFDYERLNPTISNCDEYDFEYGCCEWSDCPKYNLKEECKKTVISWLNTEL